MVYKDCEKLALHAVLQSLSHCISSAGSFSKGWSYRYTIITNHNDVACFEHVERATFLVQENNQALTFRSCGIKTEPGRALWLAWDCLCPSHLSGQQISVDCLLCTRHCARHWGSSSKTWSLPQWNLLFGGCCDSFMGDNLELDVWEALPQWQQLRIVDSSPAFPKPSGGFT